MFWKKGVFMKKGSFFKIAGSLVMLSALVSGCASYNAAPLCNLSTEVIQKVPATETGVVAVAKAFDKSDCKKFLDRDVIGEGYQPVQLYIENQSDKNYVFSLSRVSLPTARSEEVADKVHTSTVGRAVGYGAASLIIWPFLIPAIVDGIKSAEANQSLDTDFSAKAAKDQVLYPHSHMNTVIFVPRDAYQSKFNITLIEEKTREPKLLEVQAS